MTSAAQFEPLIGVTEAAQLLGISRHTVLRRVKDKSIPHLRVGQLVKFRASVLDEWVKKELQSSHSPMPAPSKERS